MNTYSKMAEGLAAWLIFDHRHELVFLLHGIEWFYLEDGSAVVAA